MKRIFKIGIGLLIHSIIPVLTWIVLSHVLGDVRISNVFSITYAIQFIVSILKHLFATGANIRKEKEGDTNAIWNGILFGTIFSITIFSVLLIFVNKYIVFFGQDATFYSVYVSYGISLLLLQTLFSFIIEKLYFEDKENLANIHMFSFNIASLLILILLVMIIPNIKIAMLVTLTILLIYIICLYIWQFEKFKVDFSFIKNFRYESANIVSSIFMLIIYLFGFKIAFSAGQEYLTALNIIGLCTDTQWDMLGAISTIAKVDISKNRYNYKNEVKNAYIYTSIVVVSSIIMAIILTQLNDVVIKIALIFLTFQVVDMFLFPYKTILSVFTQLDYSPTLNTIISFSLKALRTLLSVVIISPYCTEIGQITQGVLSFLIFTLIRVYKFKVVDNKLILKYSKRAQGDNYEKTI